MAFERGHALVIGVGVYKHHPGANIPMASGDAGELAKVLADPRRCGYEHVTLLVDEQAGRDALLAALDGLAGLDAEDTVLLFYSGHGALEPGGGYALSAHDSRFADGRVVAGSGIAESELLARLRAVRAKKMVLFINACFAGELSPHLGLEGPAVVESAGLPEAAAYAILGSGEGRILVASSRESQRSWGRAGQPTSFFGQALADGLRGGGLVTPNAGYIGAFGLYEHLYETVKEAAVGIKKEQEPELTVLKGVGPFPLALYRGTSPSGSFDAQEPLPADLPVRWVAERISKRMFEKRVVYTGGGTYVEGDYITHIHEAPDPEEIAARQREKARKAYLGALRATCQALPLAAVGEGEDEGTGADITLDQVYIDLDTTARVKREKNPKGGKKRTQAEADFVLPGRDSDERPVTALEAAGGAPRLALLGDPGAGKSTFVRHLSAWLAAAGLGEPVAALPFEADLTPVLVTLRSLAPRLNLPGFERLSGEQRQARLLEALHEQLHAELAGLGKEALAYEAGLLEDLGGGRCLLVLDGLDEVPFDLRERVREAVAAVIQRYRVARIIVTCRIRSYSGPAVLPGFEAFTLAPFDEDKIRDFSRAWYNTQYQLKKIPGQEAADRRAQNLADAAVALRELASNPMLLTSMAIIHQRDIGLPEQRVRLYSLVVDVLARRWQKHKTGDELPSEDLMAFLKDDLRLRAALERLGYEAHRASAGRQTEGGAGDLERLKTVGILEQDLGGLALAGEFLDYSDQRAGLLVGRGGEPGRPAAYGFPHRSLQEYLAGCYLVGRRDLYRCLAEHAAQGESWDLAVQLGLEELYYNRRATNTLLDLAYEICAGCEAADAQQQRLLLWSGQAAGLVGAGVVAEDVGRPDGGARYLERIRDRLVEVLGGRLPPVERAEAGRVLSRLGDPRDEVLTLEAMPFCYVPAGPFRMGSRRGDKQAYDDEQPQHDVNLPAYWLGQYPVTNAQYSLFVQAGGYRESRYWTEAAEPGYWKNGLFRDRSGPDEYRDPFGLANHPVVGVSWYEVLAFTRWLDELAHANGWLVEGWKVRLPSEAEWEKAARGGLRLPPGGQIRPLARLEGELVQASVENPAKEREYPWAGPFDAERANTSESGIRATSAVGCFPGGTSQYGCQDLSGNVWEWTRSLWKDYPYDPLDRAREDLQAGENSTRVLRGGAWLNDERGARCASRLWYGPNYRNLNGGFRVAVCRSSSEL